MICVTHSLISWKTIISESITTQNRQISDRKIRLFLKTRWDRRMNDKMVDTKK